MARPRKDALPTSLPLTPALEAWAERLGEALGRGMLRVLGPVAAGGGGVGPQAPRRRGRPPKAVRGGGSVPADKRCREPGCTNPARSRGLCSAHYQADRRRRLQAKQA